MVWFTAKTAASIVTVSSTDFDRDDPPAQGGHPAIAAAAEATMQDHILDAPQRSFHCAVVHEYDTIAPPGTEQHPTTLDAPTQHEDAQEITLTRTRRPCVAPRLDTADTAARFNIWNADQLRDMHLAVGGMRTPSFLKDIDYSRGIYMTAQGRVAKAHSALNLMSYICVVPLHRTLSARYIPPLRSLLCCNKPEPFLSFLPLNFLSP
jgi:hypothetical protein